MKIIRIFLVFVGLVGGIVLAFGQQKTKEASFLIIDKYLLYETLESVHPKMVKAKSNFIHKADSLLFLEPLSVMDKTIMPPSKDKHDYMSISIYRWPDSTKIDGLPWIRRDGIVNKKVVEGTDQRRHRVMMQAIAELSLAYWYTKNIKYANKAADLIRYWFLNENTKMNPNLNYSQSIPGKNDGSFWGIIDGTLFIWVLDAIQLLDSSKVLSNEEEKNLKHWFNEYYKWLIHSDFGKQESKMVNNHGTFYDMQVTALALYLGNNEAAREIFLKVGDNRLKHQIDNEGKQQEELRRSRSFHYSVFNLQALLVLARNAEKVGVNLWGFPDEDQSKIKEAIHYLLPFALGDQKWPHKDIKYKPEEFIYVLANAFSRYPELRNDFTQLFFSTKDYKFSELFFKH